MNEKPMNPIFQSEIASAISRSGRNWADAQMLASSNPPGSEQISDHRLQRFPSCSSSSSWLKNPVYLVNPVKKIIGENNVIPTIAEGQ
jgi:hypothetical protein